MKECANRSGNLKNCTCSYPGCSRKGMCCECIAYHRKNDEMPGCLFPKEAEKTYDRSVSKFLRVAGRGQ